MSTQLFETAGKLQKSRRAILRRTLLLGGLAGIGGVFFYRWWRRQPQAVAQRPTRYITPNRDFYTVSISPAYPRVDPDLWRLRIVGGGKPPLELSLEELSALETQEITRSLTCISNPVGGTAIGNAQWTVIALAPLLRPVIGEAPSSSRVVFHGLDGFHSSVPLQVALDSETVLALEMNGVPLPREHGFPARVLIPDRYGMKQPRWLERIEVTDEPATGYWESRGWSEEARIRASSRIDSVKADSSAAWLVQGIAFCGATTVEKVEVSDDDGAAWRQARLTSPALPGCWATWQWSWRPRAVGRHVLCVRVTDTRGRRQEEAFSATFPSGASGLHSVWLDVT